MRSVIIGLIVSAAILTCGCYETTLSLGSPTGAKVDAAYCGDWTFNDTTSASKQPMHLLILNFDDHQYYVESTAPGEKAERMGGFIIKIKSADFAQLTGLSDKGERETSHLILRVGIKDGKLSMRQLDKNFFDGVTTDAALHQKLQDNIDNPKMYEGDEQLATRDESK